MPEKDTPTDKELKQVETEEAAQQEAETSEDAEK